MNSPVGHELLLALAEFSEAFPDWRFGQMIAHLSVVSRGATQEAIWDVENEELLAAVQSQLEKRRKKAGASA